MESYVKPVKKRKDISGEIYSVLKKIKYPINISNVSHDDLLKNSSLEIIGLRPNIQYEKNLIDLKNNDVSTIKPIPNPANVHVIPCDLKIIDEVIFYCKECHCIDLCKNGCIFTIVK